MNSATDRPAGGRRITIIFNPVAGNRRRHLLDRVIAALHRDGWHVSVLGTTGPGNASTLAAQAVTNDADVIVAAGGDGTINEVVAGMQASEIPLGVIPLGTANVLAAEFGLPRRAERIAGLFAGGDRRRLHLPTANGRPFLLMSGVGFDGEVVHNVTSSLKQRLGKSAFFLQGVRALAGAAPVRLAVTVDESEHTAEWVVVTNVSRYAGSYRLVAEADPAAGSLTAVLFNRAGPLSLMAHLIRIGFGRLGRSPHVTILDARDVRIRAEEHARVPVQIDGDAAGFLPLHLTATERFIDILAPPPAAPPSRKRQLS